MITQFISACLYIFVGIISLTMAWKSIFSNKFIPFHEKAAGKSFDQIDSGVQSVILALMRISGLGFLVIALLLIFFPVVNYFYHNPFLPYAVPIIAIVYCLGLALFNYQLYIRTNTDTPWKRSLYSVAILLTGFIFSCL